MCSEIFLQKSKGVNVRFLKHEPKRKSIVGKPKAK